MNDFMDKLLRIQSEYFKRMRLLFILDLISIFSIFYAIFIIFNVEYFLNRSSLYIPVSIRLIPPIFAFIIALIMALLLHKKDRRINVSLLIENKYSELKEKLRTAYDNRDEANVIVDSLKSQVSEALDQVSSSQILAKGKILTKVLITVLFIAGMVTISTNSDKYRIPPDVISNFTDTITGNTEGTNQSIEVPSSPENIENASISGGGTILGKPKIASIEGKNIDLTLFPGENLGNEPQKTDQTQDQFRQSAAFPVDVMGSNVSDGGYSILMQKTETEKKLIDEYAVERSKI